MIPQLPVAPSRPVPLTGAGMPSAVAVKDLLFPSDLSAESTLAFNHARFLAERLGARLTLYHAVEAPPVPTEHEALTVSDEIVRRVADSAHWQLKQHVGGLSLRHEVVVQRATRAGQALIAWIRATLPDLTVMATHGRGILGRFFVGSVTELVLRETSSPLLCVREPDHGVALPYRRILLPTDLSAPSRRAFPLAALLARTFGAEVIVLHVVSEPRATSTSGVTYAVESMLPAGDAIQSFLHPDFEGVRLTIQVLAGSPWDRIIGTARAEKTDLIVMSTHGHDSVSDRILGSHTERVVRHAPCPVLVV